MHFDAYVVPNDACLQSNETQNQATTNKKLDFHASPTGTTGSHDFGIHPF